MGPRGSLIAILTLVSGCDEPVGAAQAAVNGDVDVDERFPGVMGMFVLQGDSVARCTGVLVAPNLLITARHCVSPTTGAFVICGSSPLGEPYPGSNALATTLVTMPTDDRSAFIAGTTVLVPPEGADECGFDIAALILEGSGVDPSLAAPYPMRLDAPPTEGEPFTAVGYGSTGSGGLGTRRFREGLSVACVGASSTCIPEVQPTEWQGPDDGFCQADSGAPAIDAEGQVLGVVSRGVNPCSTPILSSVFAFRDFLRSAGREAAAAGGYPAPPWADTGGTVDGGVVPADGSTDSGATGDAGTLPPAGDGGCSASAPPREHGGIAVLIAGLVALALRTARAGGTGKRAGRGRSGADA